MAVDGDFSGESCCPPARGDRAGAAPAEALATAPFKVMAPATSALEARSFGPQSDPAMRRASRADCTTAWPPRAKAVTSEERRCSGGSGGVPLFWSRPPVPAVATSWPLAAVRAEEPDNVADMSTPAVAGAPTELFEGDRRLAKHVSGCSKAAWPFISRRRAPGAASR